MSNVFLNFFVIFLLKFFWCLCKLSLFYCKGYYYSKNVDANKPIDTNPCNTRVDSS